MDNNPKIDPVADSLGKEIIDVINKYGASGGLSNEQVTAVLGNVVSSVLAVTNIPIAGIKRWAATTVIATEGARKLIEAGINSNESPEEAYAILKELVAERIGLKSEPSDLDKVVASFAERRKRAN